MAQIFIGTTLRDPHGKDKTGLLYTVAFDGGEVGISISDMPPVALATHKDDIPAFLRSLAKATLEALSDPATIHWNPAPSDRG